MLYKDTKIVTGCQSYILVLLCTYVQSISKKVLRCIAPAVDSFFGTQSEIWTGLGRLAGSEFTNVLLFYQVKLNASQNFYKMCKKFINCKLPTWPKPARTSDFDLEKYLTYRIVAIKSTCYYSENQIFCFL